MDDRQRAQAMGLTPASGDRYLRNCPMWLLNKQYRRHSRGLGLVHL